MSRASRPTAAVCEVKLAAATLIDALVDLGGIESARGPEHYFVHFLAVMKAIGTLEYNVRIVR
ncbi:hypothetical protein ACFQ1S_30290 [Kibdelosporangium lantanae]|uniref:Uncharacterized protein n=1 Tax=Kibdelosporangium lantanae TaxID=1497396 RepID=A0ABW3MFR2_9PSEU